MVGFKFGQATPRTEDPRLLRGLGRYVADIKLVRETQMYILRSPHAAARIVRIDINAALKAPGLIAVFIGEDLSADGIDGILPMPILQRKRLDGSPHYPARRPLLVTDRVRHVGDRVAAVIAETIEQARDAAELIEVDYETVPHVTDAAAAAAPGAPLVWNDAPGNVCYVERVGDEAAVNKIFASAPHVVKQRLVISRVAVNPIETRNALGVYDAREDRYTLYTGIQRPNGVRDEIARDVLKISSNRLRIVSPDVGGSFGMKSCAYPEYPLVLWAAKKIGRPVKWVCDRSDAFLADDHARDNISDVALALDTNGKFLALKVETFANLGAYINTPSMTVPVVNLGSLAGTYSTPAIFAQVNAIMTNTVPIGPLRGAGRPEASYCIERIIDIAAVELGIDRVEIRRRNMIPSAAMPFKTGLVFTYDCGEFEKTMDMALELADWKGAKVRQAEARQRGKLYGLGIASVIEIAGGPQKPAEECAEIRFNPSGGVTLIMGSHSQGQGHETLFRQLMNEFLNLEPEQVTVVEGDTDQVYHGWGTGGSRTTQIGGSAVKVAAKVIVEKGKKIAAHLLECEAKDLTFDDGYFKAQGTNKSVDLVSVAKAAFSPMLPGELDFGLEARVVYRPPGATFPNGCHLCEVEIDPDTGVSKVLRYTVVDDVGNVVNPMLVHGQIHGGVWQGAGQALFETVIYEAGSGQILSGSFMDYCMPRAGDLPSITIGSNPVPTNNNPLGVKGVGESGTVGALPAIMSGLNDALAPLGIRHFEMPATHERVWQAIQKAPKANHNRGADRGV